MFQEMGLLFQRVSAGDRKAEFRGLAHIGREFFFDHVNDILRDIIRREMQWLWHREIALGRLAVFSVKIPLPADGRIAIHQQFRFTPHVAIEIFHAQLLAVLGPAFEFGMVTQEAVVGAYLYRNIKSVGPAIQHGLHPPLASFRDTNGGCAMPFQYAGEFAGKTAAVFRIGQLHIVDGPSGGTQIFGMVTHRR